jgi:hypothetical protein
MGTGVFPGIKRPGRGVDHPPLSSAEVTETVGLFTYSPSGAFLACFRVKFTFIFTIRALCIFMRKDARIRGYVFEAKKGSASENLWKNCLVLLVYEP